jgi:hypothetical protein
MSTRRKGQHCCPFLMYVGFPSPVINAATIGGGWERMAGTWACLPSPVLSSFVIHCAPSAFWRPSPRSSSTQTTATGVRFLRST